MSHFPWLAGLILVMTLVVACGSDADEAAQAYFDGFEAAKSQHDAELPPDLFTTRSGEEVVEGLRQENVILSAFVEQIDALEVPDSVVEAHRLAAELTRERIAVQEEIANGWLSDRSLSQARNSSGSQSLSARLYRICGTARFARYKDTLAKRESRSSSAATRSRGSRLALRDGGS